MLEQKDYSELNAVSIERVMKETASGYEGSTFQEFFEETFNGVDPYIIGIYQANENLMNFNQGEYVRGPIGAIDFVLDYYLDNGFASDEKEALRCIEATDPEKLASQVAYCIAEPIFYDALSDAGLNEDDAITAENVKKFIEALD